jgi:hypothetical protein
MEMSIFGRQSSSSYTVTAADGYGCDHMGSAFIAIEAFDDQLEIIKAIHAMDSVEIQAKKEVRVMQESFADRYDISNKMDKYEALYENFITDAWDKIVAFVKKVWEKVKAFFKSLVRVFDSLWLSGKEFAKKYKDKITALHNSGALKDYKINTYVYTIDKEGVDPKKTFNRLYDVLTSKKAVPFSISHVITAKTSMEEYAKRLKNDQESILKACRGDMSVENFRTSIFKALRNGKQDKEELELSPSTVFGALIDDEVGSKLKEANSKADTFFSEYIKTIEDLQSAVSSYSKENPVKHSDYKIGRLKNDDTHAGTASEEAPYAKDFSAHLAADEKNPSHVVAALREVISIMNGAKSIALETIQMWRAAVTEREADYKKWCTGAFSHKAEKK